MSLIILMLLTAALYFWVKKILDRDIVNIQKAYEDINNGCGRLSWDNNKIQQEKSNLKDMLEQTMALYNITKQICKTLDQGMVFDIFQEEIRKYIRLSDCRFIKGDSDISQYSDYVVLPLQVNKNPIGYLLAKGVGEQDKDKFQILAQQLFLGIKRAVLYQRIQELAITDSLTGAMSRRYYLDRFSEEIKRSKEFKYNFSCLMIDIDHFKGYNDRYGHLVGDAILKEVSKAIKESIRQIDLLGRYGGEEFSVILTETNKEGAALAAERIRQDIEQRNVRVYDEDLKVTISIGVATFPTDASEVKLLIDRSDRAMYEAKNAGRNRVVTAKKA